MPGKMSRYQLPQVIDHLASNYVLGTLTPIVRKRTETLRQHYPALEQKICLWQEKLAPLDEQTSEVAPDLQSWLNISEQLATTSAPATPVTKRSFWSDWFGLGFYRGATFASMMLVVMLLGWQFNAETPSAAGLSYIAVMSDAKQQPQLVAATYGETQLLNIEVIDLPTVANNESLELWVTSKTDGVARSLGVLPVAQKTYIKQLTVAEWRLIKDSHSLLLTKEEKGGSPIGEPTGDTIAQGRCVQVSAWKESDV
jgi:anti-sigma-K factor RskA